MIRNYLRRSLWRNKTRSLLIMIGIIVSIMLVSGVNIASNRMAQQMIKEQLDEVKVDFTIKSKDDNVTVNLGRIGKLKVELPEYLTSYAVGYASYYQSIYIPDSTSINWSIFVESDESSDYEVWNWFNYSFFCGLSQNIFENPEIIKRFENLVGFNTPLNLSKEGVYIDNGFAQMMNLSTGDNLTIRLRFEEYGQIGEDFKHFYYLVNVSNIPILGTMNILEMSQLGQFVGNQYGYYPDDSRVILGNMTYIQSIITELEAQMQSVSQIQHYGESLWMNGGEPFVIQYCMLLDHSEMLNIQPSEITSRLDYIKNRIDRVGEGEFISINTALNQAVFQVQLQMVLYQALFLIISLPVLILGWYLCKTNWMLSYQQRRRELALLKVKGGSTKQLKGMFFLEALILGAIGGILGIIGGNFTSTLVLSRIYPPALQGQTVLSILGQLFSGEFMKISTWILGIIGGILISLVAVRKPLKEFAQMEPIEGLAKYHEITHNTIPKRKLDWFLLILGLFPILFTLLGDILIKQAGFGVIILLYPLMMLSTALLPFAPFMLTYALVKLLCRNVKLFQKFVEQTSRLFSKNISVFTSKSIINNQARSFRLVFIVAMALSFMVMAATVEGSEVNYQNQRATLLTGDGVRIDLYSPKLKSEGLGTLLDFMEPNYTEANVQDINWFGRLYGGGIEGQLNLETGGIFDDYQYFGGAEIDLISAKNFSSHMNIKSKWINSEYGKDAISKLADGDYCLIPDSMVEQGYAISENITIQYPSANDTDTILEKDLKIIGSYTGFPLTNEYGWNAQIIVANQTIPNGRMNQMTIVFYPVEGKSLEDIDSDFLLSLLEEWDAAGYYDEYFLLQESSIDITGSLLRFINLESLYLLTIVTFGIAIIMYISINEKAHDMGLLRARGVEKKILYKIQIAEGLTLILLGTLFTFTGIIGGAAIILQLNNLGFAGALGGIQREIFIQWGKLLLQLAGTLLAFLVSIVIAVAIETRKSDVSKISDLLRISA